MKSGASILLATAVTIALASSAAAQTTHSPTGVDAIHAYAGTWKTTIDHLDTPYSKAGHEESTLVNDCWKSGSYLACRQIVNGDPKILLVFTCRDAHDCTSYQIPADGGNPGSGKVQLDGNTWVFPWEQTDRGKTTYFRVVNVWSSEKTIDFRQEFSTDQVQWTRMASGHEIKLAEK